MKTRLTLPLIKRAALLVLLAALNPQLSTQAQGTAFTYQGRLNDGANPANGRYDLIFQVFDAASAGNSIGGSLATNGVPITSGLVAVTLNFGSTPFTGPARWLQIQVSTNAAGAFTTLGPRQPLTPAPYATYAYTAGNVTNGAITSAQLAGGAVNTGQLAANAVNSSKIAGGQVVKSLNGLTDGVSLTQGANVTINTVGNSLQISAPAGGLALPYSGTASSSGSIFTLSNSGSGPAGVFLGNVGIGLSAPTERLEVNAPAVGDGVKLRGIAPGYSLSDVAGIPRATLGYASSAGLYSTDASAGDSVLRSETGKLLLQNGSFSAGLTLNNNKVGIGTTTPQASLEVAGNTRINGQLNVNNGGFNGDTMILQARSGDDVPFFVRDSSTNSVFSLVLGSPYKLKMFGDATKTSGGTSWSILSDRRLKQDVRAYEPGLNEVLQLRPVRFRYRDDVKKGLTSDHEEVGFIAQEVREVIPDAVAEGSDGYLTLKADPIHWAAINAIQGLNQKLTEELKQKETEITELKQRLDALEKTFTIRNQTEGTKP